MVALSLAAASRPCRNWVSPPVNCFTPSSAAWPAAPTPTVAPTWAPPFTPAWNAWHIAACVDGSPKSGQGTCAAACSAAAVAPCTSSAFDAKLPNCAAIPVEPSSNCFTVEMIVC